ncbi:hypothetical protein ACPPVU_12120 [Mucilaginibacter sp. McL0603]|uniref:hypothetical protein n=1 Tax=Mucilaginibacter sp. McL0603 TaxID=3415670 RepID=UPI003CF1D0B5
MLEYELKKLEELAAQLAPGVAGKEFNAINPVTEKGQVIEKECGRISEALTKAIFTTPKENLVERYIQYHQTGLIELADQLQSYLPPDGPPEKEWSSENTAIVRLFISYVFRLLNYIERFFSKYFSLEARIPDAYRLIAFSEMSEPIESLLLKVDDHIGSGNLKECLSVYLRSFSVQKFPAHLNFRSLIYLKEFVSELLDVFGSPDVKDWEQKIAMMLIYLNFNNLDFFAYYQAGIKAELDLADTRDDYLKVLTRSLSSVKSRQTKPSFSYHPSWPTVKQMLESWLNDEIALAVIPNSVTGPHTSIAVERIMEKQILNLSVAQIACLVKLCYDEGVFGNASISEVLKFVVLHYRSKRQQQISYGSLSKEYYSISQVTAAVLRDYLSRMIVRINKNYFPVVAAICAICYGTLRA